MENKVKSNMIASIGTGDVYICLNMLVTDGSVQLWAELCEYSLVLRRYLRGSVAGASFVIREADPDDMRGLLEDRAGDIRKIAERLAADIFGEDNRRVIRDRDFVEAALMAWDGEFDVPEPTTAPVAAE